MEQPAEHLSNASSNMQLQTVPLAALPGDDGAVQHNTTPSVEKEEAPMEGVKSAAPVPPQLLVVDLVVAADAKPKEEVQESTLSPKTDACGATSAVASCDQPANASTPSYHTLEFALEDERAHMEQVEQILEEAQEAERQRYASEGNLESQTTEEEEEEDEEADEEADELSAEEVEPCVDELASREPNDSSKADFAPDVAAAAEAEDGAAALDAPADSTEPVTTKAAADIDTSALATPTKNGSGGCSASGSRRSSHASRRSSHTWRQRRASMQRDEDGRLHMRYLSLTDAVVKSAWGRAKTRSDAALDAQLLSEAVRPSTAQPQSRTNAGVLRPPKAKPTTLPMGLLHPLGVGVPGNRCSGPPDAHPIARFLPVLPHVTRGAGFFSIKRTCERIVCTASPKLGREAARVPSAWASPVGTEPALPGVIETTAPRTAHSYEEGSNRSATPTATGTATPLSYNLPRAWKTLLPSVFESVTCVPPMQRECENNTCGKSNTLEGEAASPPAPPTATAPDAETAAAAAPDAATAATPPTKAAVTDNCIDRETFPEEADAVLESWPSETVAPHAPDEHWPSAAVVLHVPTPPSAPPRASAVDGARRLSRPPPRPSAPEEVIIDGMRRSSCMLPVYVAAEEVLEDKRGFLERIQDIIEEVHEEALREAEEEGEL